MGRKGSFKVKKIHRYRKLMPYLMATRNESVVYYDTYVNAEKLVKFLDEAKEKSQRITLTHLLIKACAMGFYKNPTMNQYISGHHIYQREKAIISFSIKKEKVSKSPIKVVKITVEEDETLQELAEKIDKRLKVERSNKKTYTDKEIDLVSLLPRCILKPILWLVRKFDYYNLLPSSFTEKDPLFASLFIANLGSIGMDAAYHHLYEYGTISIFATAGKIKDIPVVENDQIVVRKVLHLRWSYDERIDDGLSSSKGIATAVEILENPYKYFGAA